MNQDLRVSVLSPIELRICFGCLVNTDFVRYDEGWFCDPRNDHIPEVAVVSLDIALTGSNCQTLSRYLSSRIGK